jgi:hypothetical protein
MAGKHGKTPETKKKECGWCKGAGGFKTGKVYIRCGRCAGKGK